MIIQELHCYLDIHMMLVLLHIKGKFTNCNPTIFNTKTLSYFVCVYVPVDTQKWHFKNVSSPIATIQVQSLQTLWVSHYVLSFTNKFWPIYSILTVSTVAQSLIVVFLIPIKCMLKEIVITKEISFMCDEF